MKASRYAFTIAIFSSTQRHQSVDEDPVSKKEYKNFALGLNLFVIY